MQRVPQGLIDALQSNAQAAFTSDANGNPQVDIEGVRLVVRDRGHVDGETVGVTAVISIPGDGTFNLGKALRSDKFTLSNGSWTPESQNSPVWTDSSLAAHLLDLLRAAKP